MSIVKILLPLLLALATCWAQDPILEDVQPISINDLEGSYRLHTNFIPKNYQLTIHPYFKNEGKNRAFTFDGKVTIALDSLLPEPAQTITLHAKALDIENKCNNETNKCNLKYTVDIGNKPVTFMQFPNIRDVDSEKDFITFSFKNEIPKTAKNFYLTLTFTGTLIQDDYTGFYRSYYIEENDEDRITQWLASTHFEPTGARRAFPCFDEPALKATFDISIIHPESYAAISNMKAKKRNNDFANDKTITTVFEQTPIMSTYLVAFVVSKYDYKMNADKTSRVWTKPEAINNTMFALDIGDRALSDLEKFTGFKYYDRDKGLTMRMEKIDQISIPQFSAGAMENWGLVTYRESSLLYEENVTKTPVMQDIATVISHEFSHQWFGNLVTPEWWKFIWLSEGFATYFQYFTTNSIQDDWRVMDQFVIKAQQESAFITDATINTRPLNKDAQKPENIRGLFDNIAYKKGACVIRMMSNFLTEERFKNGLQSYLEDNARKTVTPDKLFRAMQIAYDNKNENKLPEKVATIMKNWVDTPGYPVIHVTRSNKTGDATITQERFFSKKPNIKPSQLWFIPINYITKNDTDKMNSATKTWLNANKMKIGGLDKDDWVIFNNLQTGFYRVNYDNYNWGRLTEHLNSDKYEEIAPVTRAQLIDDAFALADAGYLDYDVALDVTIYLQREDDYIPWYAAARGLNHLDNLLRSMENYDTFRDYVNQRLNKYIDTVEFTESPKNTSHLILLGRELMIRTACRYENQKCVKFAEDQFNKYLDDKVELHPDLRDAIICTGLRHAELATWNKTLHQLKQSTNDDEKLSMLNGLSCAKNKEVVEHFLKLTLADEDFPSVFVILELILKNNLDSFDTIIDFIHKNINKFLLLDPSKTLLTDFVNRLASRVTNKEQYGKLALLQGRNHVDLLSFTGLRTATENLDWIDKNEASISKWLSVNYENLDKEKNSASSFTGMAFLMVIPMLIARFY